MDLVMSDATQAKNDQKASTEYPVIGVLAELRNELDEILKAMRHFAEEEPDIVMRQVSSYGARLTELRVQISRAERVHGELRSVRVNEIEPMLGQLQQQFNIHSRLVAMRQIDYDLVRGQF